MRIDFDKDPELAKRWLVLDAETGEPIEHVAWANDSAAQYAVYQIRPKTFNDPPHADLRIRDMAGNFALRVKSGQIELVDQSVDPFKATLLEFLDDPDIVGKLKRKLNIR